MLGVSGHKVAEALGISEPMVRKHKKGRLAGAVLKDGSFNLDRAKALYADVNGAMRRGRPAANAATAPVASTAAAQPADIEAGPALSAGSGSQESKARAVLMTEKALMARIVRRQKEKSVIEREPTLALVQTLARTFRDSLLSFTDQNYVQLAARLDYADAHRLYTVLDEFQRDYIEKTLGAIKTDLSTATGAQP